MLIKLLLIAVIIKIRMHTFLYVFKCSVSKFYIQRKCSTYINGVTFISVYKYKNLFNVAKNKSFYLAFKKKNFLNNKFSHVPEIAKTLTWIFNNSQRNERGICMVVIPTENIRILHLFILVRLSILTFTK